MSSLKILGLSAFTIALLATSLLVPPHAAAAGATIASACANPGTTSPATTSPATTSPTTAVAVAAGAPPVPLLWKVSDRDNSVYLLGSFHLLKRDDYPLSKDIDIAFDAAERLIFEVPPSEMQDPATAQKALVHAGYGDARTLSKVLPPAVREKFTLLLAQRGASIAQFEPFEPWFVNLTLVMGLSQSLGFRAEDGLDQFLMRRAASANKPTSGLESIEFQLQTLDATPMAEQIASLQEFVDDPGRMPGTLDELHRAWRRGDVARLDALTRGEMLANTPETYRLLNVLRNDAWVPKIRRMLDAPGNDDVLVVVGAMHLIGQDGVVDKLRGKGYRVERVCTACSVSRKAKR